jgi:hypothetical protein
MTAIARFRPSGAKPDPQEEQSKTSVVGRVVPNATMTHADRLGVLETSRPTSNRISVMIAPSA